MISSLLLYIPKFILNTQVLNALSLGYFVKKKNIRQEEYSLDIFEQTHNKKIVKECVWVFSLFAMLEEGMKEEKGNSSKKNSSKKRTESLLDDTASISSINGILYSSIQQKEEKLCVLLAHPYFSLSLSLFYLSKQQRSFLV